MSQNETLKANLIHCVRLKIVTHAIDYHWVVILQCVIFYKPIELQNTEIQMTLHNRQKFAFASLSSQLLIPWFSQTLG